MLDDLDSRDQIKSPLRRTEGPGEAGVVQVESDEGDGRPEPAGVYIHSKHVEAKVSQADRQRSAACAQIERAPSPRGIFREYLGNQEVVEPSYCALLQVGVCHCSFDGRTIVGSRSTTPASSHRYALRT